MALFSFRRTAVAASVAMLLLTLGHLPPSSGKATSLRSRRLTEEAENTETGTPADSSAAGSTPTSPSEQGFTAPPDPQANAPPETPQSPESPDGADKADGGDSGDSGDNAAGQQSEDQEEAESKDPAADAALEESLRRSARGGQPQPQSCYHAQVAEDFWSVQFKQIVSGTLGGFSPSECRGDPYLGRHDGNMQLALSVKRDLVAKAGCADDFEVLAWAGCHGHDHQGANVKTASASQLCDGGMSGFPPGSRCQAVGGTFHRFCTGHGKSYAVFIHPKGRATRNVDVERVAQQCSNKAGLLINFTRCIMHTGEGSGLRGVIILPTDGIPAPSGKYIRHNDWALTAPCTTDGWLYCKRISVAGRDLTVFAVQPLA